MKVMLDSGKLTPEQVVRFIEEAQVTAQLEHPSIVPVHELGVDENGNVFYTMKYVRGTSLQAVLDGIRHGDAATIRDYPLSRLLTIYLKACDALAFAHSRGVVHRDLKPDNVMLGDYGEVLVVDWGIAKVLSGGNTEPDADRPDWITEDVESIRQSETASKPSS
jgi:serine/threonine protein kinase